MKKMIHPIAITALLFTACAEAQEPSTNSTAPVQAERVSMDVDAKTFNSMIGKDNALLLDVRTPAEFKSGHIAGATNMDWTAADYETQFSTLDPSRTVMVYCAAGGRSDQAKQYLEERGFHVIQLLEGMGGWREAGLPVAQD